MKADELYERFGEAIKMTGRVTIYYRRETNSRIDHDLEHFTTKNCRVEGGTAYFPIEYPRGWTGSRGDVPIQLSRIRKVEPDYAPGLNDPIVIKTPRFE